MSAGAAIYRNKLKKELAEAHQKIATLEAAPTDHLVEVSIRNRFLERENADLREKIRVARIALEG